MTMTHDMLFQNKLRSKFLCNSHKNSLNINTTTKKSENNHSLNQNFCFVRKVIRAFFVQSTAGICLQFLDLFTYKIPNSIRFDYYRVFGIDHSYSNKYFHVSAELQSICITSISIKCIASSNFDKFFVWYRKKDMKKWDCV